MSDAPDQRMAPSENSLRRSVVWTAWMALAHFGAGAILLAALLQTVPKFAEMFDEFGAELPAMTVLVIGLSHVVVRYWYLLVPLALLVDAVILFGLSRLPAEARWLGIAWAGFVFLVVMVLLAFVVIAIFVPFFLLMEHLS